MAKPSLATQRLPLQFVLLFPFIISVCLGLKARYYLMLFGASSRTQCWHGLLEDVDTFIYRARAWTVGPANFTLWPKRLQFQIQTSTGTYKPICSVQFGPCNTSLSCDCKDLYGGLSQVTLNKMVKGPDGGKQVRLIWSNVYNNESLTTTPVLIKPVYVEGQEKSYMKVNWDIVDVRAAACEFSLLPGVNALSYCCIDGARNCTSYLRQDATGVNVVGDPCATMNVNSSDTGWYTMSHSVCERPPQKTHICHAASSLMFCSLQLSLQFAGTTLGREGQITCGWNNTCPGRPFALRLRTQNLTDIRYLTSNDKIVGSMGPLDRVDLSNMAGYYGEVRLTVGHLSCGHISEYVCTGKYEDNFFQTEAVTKALYKIPNVTEDIAAQLTVLQPEGGLQDGVFNHAKISLKCMAEMIPRAGGRIAWVWYRDQRQVGPQVMATANITKTTSPRSNETGPLSLPCTSPVSSTFTFLVSSEDNGARVACFVDSNNAGIHVTNICTRTKDHLCAVTHPITVWHGVTEKDVIVEKTNETWRGDPIIVLTCRARGTPPPKLVWTKEDGIGVRRQLRSVDWNIRVSQLVLGVAVSGNSGVYRCTATNVVKGQVHIVSRDINVVIDATAFLGRKRGSKSHEMVSALESFYPPLISMTTLAAVILLALAVFFIHYYWTSRKPQQPHPGLETDAETLKDSPAVPRVETQQGNNEMATGDSKP